MPSRPEPSPPPAGATLPTLLSLLLLLTACGEAGPDSGERPPDLPYTGPPAHLAVEGVNVVDVETGTIHPNRVVAIREGRVVWIGSKEADGWYDEGTRILQGEGRYLTPGLWDMHIHLRGGPDLVEANRALLPVYLAHGVTTIRDAGGDLASEILAWRDSAAAGSLLSPRIFTAGPKLEGPTGGWAGSLRLHDMDDVGLALDSVQALGVDMVKVNDVSMTREVYLASVSEAARRGLLVTGHMPFTVRYREVVEAGLSAISHLHYPFKGSATNEESVTREFQARFGTDDPLGLWEALGMLIPNYDERLARETFRHMVEHGTGAIPTLHIMEVLAEVERTDHSRDPGLHFIHPDIEATYRGRVESARLSTPEQREEYRALRDIFRRMIVPMHEEGVLLLAGSDAGPFNAHVYPGVGLHAELEALVRAGLPELEALRSATVNAARFVGLEAEAGQIRPGYRADLLLLEANPLEDISAVRRVAAVILAGDRVLERPELDALLQDASEYRREALGLR